MYKAMFFGDYVEKGQEEVELKDIVYEVSANVVAMHRMVFFLL